MTIQPLLVTPAFLRVWIAMLRTGIFALHATPSAQNPSSMEILAKLSAPLVLMVTGPPQSVNRANIPVRVALQDPKTATPAI